MVTVYGVVLPYRMSSGNLADILPTGTPTMGNAKAPIVLVEFSDFTCGYCGKFFRETLPRLDAQYFKAGNVRFAYRDYPRDEGGIGLVAAHAARCAGEQDRYWDMHDRLFTNASRLGTSVIMKAAKDIGLKMNLFTACMDSQKHVSAILADRDLAVKLGFRGTPGFFMARTDGKRFTDAFLIPGALPYQTFQSEIEKLLKKT